jgi:hypothetical protein
LQHSVALPELFGTPQYVNGAEITIRKSQV